MTTAANEPAQRRVLAAAEQLHLAGQPLGWLAEEIERFPASAGHDLALGRMVMTSGRFDDARPLLERAWDGAESPDVAGAAAELLAIVAIGTLRADDVLQWSRRAMDAGIDHLSAVLVCHGLAMAGMLDEARDEMSLRLQRPLSARAATDARLARAIVELWSNDLDGALADLDVATRDGNEAGFLPYVNANAYQAEALLRLGRPVEALAVAESCLARDRRRRAAMAGAVAAGDRRVRPRRPRPHRRCPNTDRRSATRSPVPPVRFRRASGWRMPASVSRWTSRTTRRWRRSVTRSLAAGWASIPEGVHHWRARVRRCADRRRPRRRGRSRGRAPRPQPRRRLGGDRRPARAAARVADRHR